ncbi:MAG TPA: RagB/SusD family nutrient uptake outer membrane protein [Cyclobacteriaceae bacterium]|nr:RagB/SusD family nutrient uptake outer membrane protein [Cyclobacteriaceae bacterium]
MRRILTTSLLIILVSVVSCTKDFLDYKPTGIVTDEQLNTPENVEKLTNAAYAAIGNDEWRTPFTFMWPYGSVRGGDAYKGGGGVNDQVLYDYMEKFNLVTVDNGRFDEIWVAVYEGIARANDATIRMNKLDDKAYPQKNQRMAEMRFIRGHFHFLMKILFKYVPYIDETVAPADRLAVGNSLTNEQLWNKIADDFKAAADVLPVTQAQVGRVTKGAAWAYLAKVRLFQAYEQDANNQVTGINTARLQEVVTLCNNVINTGKYALAPDFGHNFLYPFSENNSESVFAIQYSLNDGTPEGRINKAASLNYNMSAPYGCCSFHAPSREMVNSFKTDAAGLPLFDTYNLEVMEDSMAFWRNYIDPRLDHTSSIPTHPFKYQPNFIAKAEWQRVPAVYGPYTPMKEIAQASCSCFKKIGSFFGSSTNIDVIRYDDVLLWLAEAYIELGQQDLALPLINSIRTRAGNSTGMLKYANGKNPSNYNIKTYVNGVNCTWTQAYARKALRWERRVEFAMEGQHFFDIVRWGVAADVVNTYFATEKKRNVNLASAFFTKGRDEYLPIPQNQITLTNGLYKQNANY